MNDIVQFNPKSDFQELSMLENTSIEELNEFLKLKLDINDLNNKESYEIVYNAHQQVKKYLSELEKRRKKVKAPVLEYAKVIDDFAEKIKNQIIPIRDHLQAQRDIIDKEKERIKQQKEIKIKERKNALFAAGMSFNGEAYFVGTISISEEQIELYVDSQFNLLLEAAREEKKRMDDLMRPAPSPDISPAPTGSKKQDNPPQTSAKQDLFASMPDMVLIKRVEIATSLLNINDQALVHELIKRFKSKLA